MVRDEHGHWDLPGGRMRCGENIKETLEREVREELGIKEFLSFQERPYFIFSWHNKERKAHGIVVGFLADMDDRGFRLSTRRSSIEWIGMERLKNLNIANLFKPHYLRVIEKIWLN